MGGSYDEQSTEIFNIELGEGQSGFRLQYPSRGACVISDDITNTAIVTAREQVSRYDSSGWIEDLPSMQQLRNWHGCGSYTSNEGSLCVWLNFPPNLFCCRSTSFVSCRWMGYTKL